MKTAIPVLIISGACALILTSTAALAQGTLTPPGPPAPTMKTLDQVEARIIVNSNNTPGDSTTLFKITQPGSYYLTTNITGVSGMAGIAIESSQVTLDLNGFSLTGVPGSLDGIRNTNGAIVALTIRNGIIRDWDGNGISGSGYGAIFSDLLAFGNGGDGMDVFRATVRDCVAEDNGDAGISATESGIINCSATGNSTGFILAYSCHVEGCTAKFNSYGLDVDSGSIVMNNSVQASDLCGIVARSECRVIGNLVTDGQSDAPGILVGQDGTNNVIQGNTAINNPGGGFVLTETGVLDNILLGNTATGNSPNYQMGAGNSYGPIVNVNGVGDISAVSNANFPGANFSY
ncbi:MAG TPA: right-handed parallel beta-helix repeat-containing protein [Verrucomicrobiae bacterium]|jgi:parallel beta-helix repeat protein|nr:right-handed parallel beta-helix repeat-containing protein [Verrucomicrobiae bacterium]